MKSFSRFHLPPDPGGRPSHEGRGLKYPATLSEIFGSLGRPSHEGRGLKYSLLRAHVHHRKSSLSRGTWIEIGRAYKLANGCWSSLSRGTWIEILPVLEDEQTLTVVPLTRDVD